MTNQQVDSIDHMITNIPRDMIMSVHNEIVFYRAFIACSISEIYGAYTESDKRPVENINSGLATRDYTHRRIVSFTKLVCATRKAGIN